MNTPKVSIVMPSLNVRPYIEQCIESVLRQTLPDLEIICVDAGSGDGTRQILQHYADTDPRVRILDSDRKSYGYQVNLGIDAAQGEYLGIVETDDFAEPDMFEKLYRTAAEEDLDVCKSGFFFYWSDPAKADQAAAERAGGDAAVRSWRKAMEERAQSLPADGTGVDVPYPMFSDVMASRVFCPVTDFPSTIELVDFFNLKPSIWSAVYKRSFLEEHHIRLNETPGASFQDTAFNFKVWALARRVRVPRSMCSWGV